jgi:hypothetical protein
MLTIAALIRYPADILERRGPVRPAHLANLERLRDEGRLLMAGAWADPVDGALFIYRAETIEDVQAMIAADPYAQAGLFEAVELRAWNVVVGAPAD